MTTDRLDPEMTTRLEGVLLECQSICERMEGLCSDLAVLGLMDQAGLFKWYASQIREKLPMGMLKGER